MRITALILFLVAILSSVFGRLVLNEVVYVNQSGLQDEDGDTPDWIEVYNSGTESVQLEGYGLSDNEDRLRKWQFPNTTLGAGEYLLVYASGKNRKASNLHTNFRLGLMKEPVLLSDAEGHEIDRFHVQCVPADRSAARLPDGADTWEIVHEPTPASSNNASEIYHVNFRKDSIYPSDNGGYYNQAFGLELSQRVTGNKIYYTLNGEEPDEEANLYTGTITMADRSNEENVYSAERLNSNYQEPDQKVFKATAFRAQSYSDGCPASNEINETYFIYPQFAKRYGVPIISIISDPDNLFSDEEGILVLGNNNNSVHGGGAWERPVNVEVFYPDGEQVINQPAGARIHGRGTRLSAQRSIRLYSGDKYGTTGFNHPLFADRNLDSYDKILLRTTRGDWTDALFADLLSHHLVRDLNTHYMSGTISVLFINGEYWGIQNMRERQDSAYLKRHHPQSSGWYDIADYVPSAGIEAKEGNLEAYNELLDVLDDASLGELERYDELAERIDLANMIDYYVAQMYLGNVDFPELNQRMWRDSVDGKWQWLFFDCDGCYFRYNYDHLSDYFNQEEKYDRYADWSMYLLREMLKIEQFRHRFFQRFYWAIDNVFTPQKVLAAIDSLEAIYRPLMAEHIQRWRDPSDLVTWQHNVDKLRNFAVGRPLEVTEQLMKYYGNPLRVYPNPAADYVRIESSLMANADTEFTLYDLSGRAILRRIFTPGATVQRIQIPRVFDSGVYLIQAQTGYIISTEKLLINHE